MTQSPSKMISYSDWRCRPANQITDLGRSKNGFDLEKDSYNIRLMPTVNALFESSMINTTL